MNRGATTNTEASSVEARGNLDDVSPPRHAPASSMAIRPYEPKKPVPSIPINTLSSTISEWRINNMIPSVLRTCRYDALVVGAGGAGLRATFGLAEAGFVR